MSKAEEAQRYAVIGMLADMGKLDKVKNVQAQIAAIVSVANAEEEGIGDFAISLVALDIAIAQG